MPLEDQIRQSAEGLASDLGRTIQDRLDKYVSDLLATAAAERDAALAAQAEHFTAGADARVRDEVAKVREEAAGELAVAVNKAREAADAETAQAVAKAREEASSEAAILVARVRDEVAEATAQLEADLGARQAESDRQALERQMGERDAMLAEMERLVESFRRLDAAATLKSLLDVLADATATESARTAVFLVRGHELQGWRFTGFEQAPADPRQVSVPLDAAAGLASAVRGRTRSEVSPGEPSSGLAFMALPAGNVGVAVPVIVGGDVAALVYGDDGAAESRMVPAGWPEALELLSRHAARCLEAQTAIRAARLGSVPSPAGLGSRADSRIDAGVSVDSIAADVRPLADSIERAPRE